MEPQKIEPKVNKSKTISKQGLYSKIAVYDEKILQTLIDCLDSKNEPVRIAAARTLLNKIVPDLQAVQHKGDVAIRLPMIWIPKEKDHG